MVDNDGRNAISWACSGGHHVVVDYLIKHDPKGVDKVDVDGWAPLAWATFTEAPELMQTLLRSGLVDVNKKDKNGRSVLSHVAGYGYLAVVKILLSVGGIEVDSEDNNGRTPLIYRKDASGNQLEDFYIRTKITEHLQATPISITRTTFNFEMSSREPLGRYRYFE
ncbi:MAG: hypothetical protein Q9226_005428 [Calogaya cf. arnoldii]